MLRWSHILFALVAAVVYGPPGVLGEGVRSDGRRLGAKYSVSQTHSLTVRNDGLIDIVLSIVFNVAPGSVLSGSRKTILSDFGMQTLVGPVTATDASGESLFLETSSDSQGWFKVEFDFAKPVDGSVSPQYTVNLAYSVKNGVCLADSGRARFSLPWAHRWIVRVIKTQYEIAFASSSADMSTVCLGTSGFRPRCGSSDLTISGTRASHMVAGVPRGAYFEWSSNGASFRACGAETPTLAPPTQEPQGLVADLLNTNTAKPLEQEGEPVAAMTLGIAGIGGSLLFAAGVLVWVRKPVHGRQALQDDSGEEFGGKEGKDNKLELDLEEGASDSTVASIGESPRFAARDAARRQQQLRNEQSMNIRPTPAQQRLGHMNGNSRFSPPKVDTGAGLGIWDVPEEFEQEELAALNQANIAEYSIQMSENSPSHHMYGKSDNDGLSRHHSVEAIELDVQSSCPSSPEQAVDPYAVGDFCDDAPVEDIFVQSTPKASMRPTMGIETTECPPSATMVIKGEAPVKSNKERSLHLAAKSKKEGDPSSSSTRHVYHQCAPTASWDAMEEFGVADSMAINSQVAVTPSKMMFPEGGLWEAASESEDEDGAHNDIAALQRANSALVQGQSSPEDGVHNDIAALQRANSALVQGQSSAQSLAEASQTSMLQPNLLLPPAPPMSGSAMLQPSGTMGRGSSLKAASVPSRNPDDDNGHYVFAPTPRGRSSPPDAPQALPGSGGSWEACALPAMPPSGPAKPSISRKSNWSADHDEVMADTVMPAMIVKLS